MVIPDDTTHKITLNMFDFKTGVGVWMSDQTTAHLKTRLKHWVWTPTLNQSGYVCTEAVESIHTSSFAAHLSHTPVVGRWVVVWCCIFPFPTPLHIKVCTKWRCLECLQSVSPLKSETDMLCWHYPTFFIKPYIDVIKTLLYFNKLVLSVFWTLQELKVSAKWHVSTAVQDYCW